MEKPSKCDKQKKQADLDGQLIDAILAGDTFGAIDLLECGASPGAERGHEYSTECAALLAMHDIDILRALLAAAEPAGLPISNDGKLLACALASGAGLQAVRLLMQEGEKRFSEDLKADSARQAVSSRAQAAACEMLRAGWIDARDVDFLLDGCWAGMGLLVALMLSKGADPSACEVNEKKSIGYSALCVAAQKGDAWLVAKLLSAGGDPNVGCGEGGRSALALAALQGGKSSDEIVEALMRAGANVEALCDKGRTPLMLAAGNRNAPAVAKLLAGRVQVEAKDRKGGTALMWACARGCADSVGLLLACGADPDAKADGPEAGQPGVSAAMICCEKSSAECLILLVRAGANLDARDEAGRSAEDWLGNALDRNNVNSKASCEAQIRALAERTELAASVAGLRISKGSRKSL